MHMYVYADLLHIWGPVNVANVILSQTDKEFNPVLNDFYKSYMNNVHVHMHIQKKMHLMKNIP